MKNISCGEGGALVLNKPADIERAHVLHDKGTNRRSFQLGEVDKYTWVDTGSSFGLSDLLAAYLTSVSLRREWEILKSRQAVFDHYEDQLSPMTDQLGIELPRIPNDREQAYHSFYVLLPDLQPAL